MCREMLTFAGGKQITETMYTATMTPAEIDRETQEDMRNVLNKVHYKQEDFRRMVLKATRFPVTMTYEQNTKRKNRWVVGIEAFSKRNTGPRSAVRFHCIHESVKGKFLYIPTPDLQRGKGMFKTTVIKPHFMSRFRERMGLEETGEPLIQLVIDAVMTMNNLYLPQPDGRTLVISTLKGGFGFGEAYMHGTVTLLRTFVPQKMMFRDQRRMFAETDAEREQMQNDNLEHLRTMTRQSAKEPVYGSFAERPTYSTIPSTPREFKQWMERAREIAPEIDRPQED